MEVSVVITAGGSGERIGGVPKQYRMLGGRPVLRHTIDVFARWAPGCRMAIVVPHGDADRVRLMIEDSPVEASIVDGGATRQESVLKGLRSLSASGVPSSSVVMIHDGVRPFVTTVLLDRVMTGCERFGASAPAVGVSDTLREVRDGWFGGTVARGDLYGMQTPQAFRLDRILKAHEDAAVAGLEATDDVEVYLRAGGRVEYVEGSAANIKITTVEDLELAEMQLTRRAGR